MNELESKINNILENPEAMKKIMSLAQSLNLKTEEQPKSQQHENKTKGSNTNTFPEIDLSMLQKLSGLAKQTGIDKNEQTLLKALAPYLSRERIYKLEKAMRAAKMAKIASTMLGTSLSPQRTCR